MNAARQYLKDYTVPSFLISESNLTFELGESESLVTGIFEFERNPESHEKNSSCVLDGEDLDLVSLCLDGKKLEPSSYSETEVGLEIHNVPDKFQLQIKTRIHPEQNTSCEGLYQSNQMFCTQCEAHGFRKIIYYLDRPDVMATFTTKVIANKTQYPVLLSNGNLVDKGEDGDKHWAVWHDPFIKPCYLFALVAGDLACIQDTYTTGSGRDVLCQFYVEHHNKDKCDHAMQSLQKAMKWDEEAYGREYDLDRYMVVAVEDFNMGAMENKGLNIFNSKFVLASPETATDVDYQNVEDVIAHEYFHNWTGNRITCRDWFQLSLKEGLTVFREQSFSADMTSKALKRIQDVRMLRATQFPEDSSPLAHPVKPKSYVEMNNFYTATIYEKGAEVIRMIETLVGTSGFRKGMDLYFERHDGQAVTTEDFVASMEDANEIDLTQFKYWYDQAGTPHVWIEKKSDKSGELLITCRQGIRHAQHNKEALLLDIPICIAFIDPAGVLVSSEHEKVIAKEHLVRLNKEEQTFRFSNLPEKVVPSFFRKFSSPVECHYDYSVDENLLLLEKDVDLFNRWESAQRLLRHIIKEDIVSRSTEVLLGRYSTALNSILDDKTLDNAVKAELISMPSLVELIEHFVGADFDKLTAAVDKIKVSIAVNMESCAHKAYTALQSKEVNTHDYQACANRQLKNQLLKILSALPEAKYDQLISEQFNSAKNMTNQEAALSELVNMGSEHRSAAINTFYAQWQAESLVVDKWFSMQARADRKTVLDEVKALLNHPKFTYNNPNKVRALIGAFCQGNLKHFHRKDGAGYDFLFEQLKIIDPINPQVASRLIRALASCSKLDAYRQSLIATKLKDFVELNHLSKDVKELAEAMLASPL